MVIALRVSTEDWAALRMRVHLELFSHWRFWVIALSQWEKTNLGDDCVLSDQWEEFRWLKIFNVERALRVRNIFGPSTLTLQSSKESFTFTRMTVYFDPWPSLDCSLWPTVTFVEKTVILEEITVILLVKTVILVVIMVIFNLSKRHFDWNALSGSKWPI